ncbi:hypothetical protein BJ742DRAFT_735537 [Cladochytrium replicatum]|nr:hypothetical protein BJ742DRAFT_735537 [Cladochytrium replicatum]
MRSLHAAAILAVAAFPLLGVAQVCDQGVLNGFFCFNDCTKVDGLPFGFYYPIAEPLVTAIDLQNFQLEFDSKDPWNPLITSYNVSAKTKIPSELALVNLHFDKASTNATIGLQGKSPVARLVTSDSSPAQGDTDSGNLFINFDRVPLSALSGAQTDFSDLFKTVTLTSGDINLSFSGYANSQASAPEFGLTLCLNYIPFAVTSTLKGLGGLTGASIGGIPVVLGGSPTTGLKLSIALNINSPSNVLLKTNTDVTFQLVYSKQVLGSVVIPKISIAPGENKLTATGFLFPKTTAAKSAARDLLSKFVAGVSSQVTVTNGKSSNVPSLDAAFGAVTLTQALPAKKQVLLKSARFGIPNLLAFTTKAKITATNPFDAAVSLTYVKGSLIYKDKVIGTIDESISGYTIPAKATVESPEVTLNLKLNYASILAVFAAIGNTLSADVDSELTISFGGYQTTVDYNQDDVKASLVLHV